MDNRRYGWKLEWLKGVVGDGSSPVRLLEVGGCGNWTDMLLERYPWITVVPTEGDLRTCSYGKDGEFDVVVSAEVLEHLHNRNVEPPAFANPWLPDATDHHMAECARVLKPGGHLLLTTPNACSINIIWKVLNWSAGMLYRPHAREYTPLELRTMVKNAGLQEVRYETVEPWSIWHETEEKTRAMYRRLEQMLAVNGFSTMDRGEDQMLLARKP